MRKIDGDQMALAAIMGRRVRFSPFVRSDRPVVLRESDGQISIVAFSSTALNLIVHRVLWHDERTGCPTWTGASSTELGGACRCDVEVFI